MYNRVDAVEVHMNIMELDELDKKILEVIKEDARLSYSDIGDRVGVSRVSVKNHMEAMESSGIIKGYKTIIDNETTENGKRFFIDLITVPEKYNQVLEYLASNDCIVKIYAITGECKIRAEGYVATQNKRELFMQNFRRHTDGIKGFGISDVLCTYLNKEKAIDNVRTEKEQTIQQGEGDL